MTCPVCGGDTTVNYTHKECDGVYRRRKCKVCKHTFYTTELESDISDFARLDKLSKYRRLCQKLEPKQSGSAD